MYNITIQFAHPIKVKDVTLSNLELKSHNPPHEKNGIIYVWNKGETDESMFPACNVAWCTTKKISNNVI